MIEAALAALATLADPFRLGMMMLGVGIGIIVAMLPGLSGVVGLALALPFIYGMDPAAALAVLISMAAVMHTADSFPAVLIGTPGTAGSQATIMDGYPLAQRGEALRALSAGFAASLIGGLFGALVLFMIIPVARPLALAFGSPELFMLTLLGLTLVGVLSGRRPLRGVVLGVIGMFIGAIGVAPAAPVFRYTFGQPYLYDGLPIVAVTLGLFAFPEMVDLLRQKRSIAATGELGKGWLQGLQDVVRERWLVLRSATIGVCVGIIPGIGGAVVDWIAYGQAVQMAKDRQGFGKGDIRGVIAPEAANNAKEGGTLVPTLVFGIPGSATTAVLLGGLILIGLQPGPRMVTHNLDATLVIIWTLALANVVGALACLVLSRPIARLTLIPAPLLVPVLFAIMLLGAYQSTRHWGDLLLFLAMGVFGWILKQVDWPRVPVLIGYILALSAERYLWISVSRYGVEWLLRPGVIIIALLILVFLLLGLRGRGMTPVQQGARTS
jgi:putative tricarboxylic transport membrane protein